MFLSKNVLYKTLTLFQEEALCLKKNSLVLRYYGEKSNPFSKYLKSI